MLENLKKTGKLKLNKSDSSDLFNVLNGFKLRHSSAKDKTEYIKDIFYPWIFSKQLSALDASTL
ncbi:hypothetical protein CR194_05260 [Salipaludibacillus keqinensis]|uniref:Uncharacterized protein n=1 Tax=Salipaludibacillus keqinensis TaxID=2045207 RepID=A0A323TII0_9BACI|nr:hypothetical protein [Salipaludibacillus keqinensis]PYZ94932.1 hypothetical protein CR194_05260 [Salipaludibacillus keqinensis]